MTPILEESVNKTIRGLVNVFVADQALKNIHVLDIPSPQLEGSVERFVLAELFRILPSLQHEPFTLVAWRKDVSETAGELNVEMHHARTWEELHAKLIQLTATYKRWRSTTEPNHWQSLLRAQRRAYDQVKKAEVTT